MKRVLVTGGAGFIGSHLTDELVRRGYRVTVYDSIDPQVHPDGLPEYLNLGATFIRGDVRDRAALKEAVEGADAIFHFAAAVGVGQSQYKIAHYVDVNTLGTATLLDILANERHSVRKLVVASSMSIYGEGLYACPACGPLKPELRTFEGVGPEGPASWEPACPACGAELAPVPTPEETPLAANSIYAITKKDQEEMTILFGATYGLPSVALRFFNVYGPRQSLSNPYTGVCAIFLSRIKNGNPPVIYEDGLQTRDFIWVEDLVAGCVAAMESDRADGRVVNLGTGTPVSIKAIAESLIRLLGGKMEPAIARSYRKGDVRHCYADASRARELLGFSAKVSLDEGLGRLIGWARDASAVDRFGEAEGELRQKGLVE